MTTDPSMDAWRAIWGLMPVFSEHASEDEALAHGEDVARETGEVVTVVKVEGKRNE